MDKYTIDGKDLIVLAFEWCGRVTVEHSTRSQLSFISLSPHVESGVICDHGTCTASSLHDAWKLGVKAVQEHRCVLASHLLRWDT